MGLHRDGRPLALLNDSCVRTDHAAATVPESYSGWLRLVKLAIHAMQTVDTSCSDAGIAYQQQLGVHWATEIGFYHKRGTEGSPGCGRAGLTLNA